MFKLYDFMMEVFVCYFFQNKGKNMHLGNTIARKIYLPSSLSPQTPNTIFER
jgi:hypothetical protein